MSNKNFTPLSGLSEHATENFDPETATYDKVLRTNVEIDLKQYTHWLVGYITSLALIQFLSLA